MDDSLLVTMVDGFADLLEEIQSIIDGFSQDTRVVTPNALVELMTDFERAGG